MAANGLLSGDDIESALTIIEKNGGAGDYEDANGNSTVERWLYPRYIPVCADHGGDTQMVEAKETEIEIEVEITKGKNKGKTKIEKQVELPEHEYVCPTCGKGADVDERDKYLSRAGLGDFDTDVETLASWLEAPRNVVGAILLLSEPGTGKTALIESAVTLSERTLTTVVCTPDHTKDSLFLRFVGEGKGDEDSNGNRTPYTLGPLPYAAKHGHVLYLDEFMLLPDGVKPITYSLSDGRRYLPEGNVDGSALEIHPDFRIVYSSNPQVRGASLPEPIASRCAGTTMHVQTDAALLRDLGIDDAIINAWEALRAGNFWTPQIREVRAADYWLPINPAQAVSAMVPEHAPESERDDITNTLNSFIGGDTSTGGRLVVK